MVFHHGSDTRIADHGRAQFTKRPGTICAPAHQPERLGGHQQPVHGFRGKTKPRGQGTFFRRGLVQRLKKLQPHTSGQHLRIDKASAEIE